MTALHPIRQVSVPPGKSGALEFRELRCFASVARAGNFGRAALELNISRPTISQQVGRLEEELGTQLLIRHGRGVTLTPSGACLLERLDAIMHLLAAPLEHDSASAAVSGTVSVGLPAEVGPLLVSPLVETFRRRWPRVALDIKEAVSGALESWVLDRRIDVALMQDPPILDELRIEPLLTESPGVVASPRAAVADCSRPLRLREVAELPLILPNPQHWIRRRLTSAGIQRGIAFDPVFQIDSPALTREMVRNGLGCTVLPSMAVREEIARGTLVFRPIDQPSLATTHAVAFHRAGSGPVVLAMVELIRESIRSLVADGAWTGARLVTPCADPIGMGAEPLLPMPAWQVSGGDTAQQSLEQVEGD